MSESNSYGFGGKLVAAIVLALLGGYVWACIEKGQSPLAILKIFSSTEEPAVTKAAAPKKEAPKVDPVPVKKPDPPKTVEPVSAKKPDPIVAPTGPKLYSATEMGILFSDTDDLLRRGKLFEAREKVQNTSRLMIPQDSFGQFTHYEGRVGRYHSLLLETSKGGTIEMPKMTQLLIKEAGKLVVKVLNEDRDWITYETLTGIRSKIAKARCEDIKPLEPVYARVEVSLELKKQADYKGLVLEQDPGKTLTLKEKPGRKASSLQIFDLADFCARNGANDKLVPLFDEALGRDPDLLNTVHEAKADRMVEVLIYFLSINSASDARKTADLLKERYADTKSYRDRVATDTDISSAMDLVLKRPMKPIAKLDQTPPKPVTAPPSPVEKPEKSETPGPPPVTPPTPTPKPETPPESARSTDADRPLEPTSVGMPDGTNAKISDLVVKGDRYFNEAMVHLRNSDPSINPDGWADENKKALKLFMQANGEGYMPAQDMYSASVPTQLLDRVRETSMRTALCRKRSVSVRR